MRRSQKPILVMMLLAVLLCWAVCPTVAAEKITMTATVSDGYQLIGDDGYPYEVEDTDTGNELVLQYVGRKVEVTGTVKEAIDYRVIDVDSFRVIEED